MQNRAIFCGPLLIQICKWDWSDSFCQQICRLDLAKIWPFHDISHSSGLDIASYDDVYTWIPKMKKKTEIENWPRICSFSSKVSTLHGLTASQGRHAHSMGLNMAQPLTTDAELPIMSSTAKLVISRRMAYVPFFHISSHSVLGRNAWNFAWYPP